MRKQVLLYGLLCGVVIATLRLIEYRWLVLEYSVEIYGELIAAVFAGLGIWLGLRLTRHTETVIVREVEVPARPASCGTRPGWNHSASLAASSRSWS